MTVNDSVKIIDRGYVFTADHQRRAGRFSILIRNDRIAEVSARGEVFKAMHPTAEVIDARGKIVLPGFIDAHIHGESVLLSSVTEGRPMARWDREADVRRSVEFLSSATPDELKDIYELAYFSALKAGVTTLAEAGWDRQDLPLNASVDAARRAEIRVTIALHNGDEVEAAPRLKHPAIRYAVSMPDEESLTTYNLQTTLRLARDHRWSVMLAHGETRKSHDILKKNFRKSLCQLMQEYGVFEYPLQLVHLAYFDDGDLEILAPSGTPVIMSPRAVLRKGTDMPPVAEFLRRKIPVALATDWGTPDPLANMRTFSDVVSLAGLTPPRPTDLLAMVTTIPALALGMDSDVGSLEAGKRADIVFVEVDDVRFASIARWDHPSAVLALLTGSGTSLRVQDVMVNGEFAVRDGHILTYAEEDLIRHGQELLVRMLGNRPGDQPAAPVPHTAEQPVPRMTVEEKDQPFEEGFRIVQKGSASEPGSGTVLPLKPDRGSGKELPKTVRKVFGDDEG